MRTSDVVFAEATPEQRVLSWQLNAVAWAAPLSIDDYILREHHLSQQDLSKDGNHQYWALYLKDKPDQIVASCETIRKPLLIAQDGKSRKGYGYGIASVYTNPGYRRKGMAALMLCSLQEEVDKHSDCSILYSDIGRAYYANLGWAIYSSLQVMLSHTTPPDGKEFTQSQLGRTKYLAFEELRDLCEVDELHFSKRFDGFPADGKTRVGFLPSFAQIAWQLAREGFMADKTLGKSPENKGAITDHGRSWVYWAHDWRAKKLKVMRIAQALESTLEQRVDDTKVLLEAALEEARTWGLAHVVVWNPDETATQGAKAVGNAHPDDVKVVFEERAGDSIPSLRMKQGGDTANVAWEDNFYYAWC